MADNFRFAQLQPYSLSGAGVISGATSITLKSMTDIDGTALSMSGTFGSIGFGTLEPGNGALEEQISFTGLTNNTNGTVTLTGVSNVTFVYPYTQTSGLSKTHAGSTTFVISNTSGFYDKMTAKTDDETITGTWTFTSPNYPQMDTVAVPPTLSVQFATKGYADSLSFSGTSDASTTQKGIVEIATTGEIDTGNSFGSTGAYIVVNPSFLAGSTYNSQLPTAAQKAGLAATTTPSATNLYVTQSDSQKAPVKYGVTTGSANAYVLVLSPSITAYTAGMEVNFKANFANTTSPTIAINGLTPTVIKNSSGSPMVANEIINNQVVKIIYNGTTFQTVSPPNGTLGNNVGGVTNTGTTSVTVAQVSNVDTTIRSVFVPAMGANDYVEVMFDTLNGGDMKYMLKSSNTTMYTTYNYSNVEVRCRVVIMNRGATNSQIAMGIENSPAIANTITSAVDLSAGATISLMGYGANTNNNVSQFMIATLYKNQS